jgi:hypothetical protein
MPGIKYKKIKCISEDIHYCQQMQGRQVVVCKTGRHFGPQPVYSRVTELSSKKLDDLTTYIMGEGTTIQHTFRQANSSKGSMRVSVMYLLHLASTTCSAHSTGKFRIYVEEKWETFMFTTN